MPHSLGLLALVGLLAGCGGGAFAATNATRGPAPTHPSPAATNTPATTHPAATTILATTILATDSRAATSTTAPTDHTTTTIEWKPATVGTDGVRHRSGTNVNVGAEVGEPTRLVIPSIGVDTSLSHLGIAPDGSAMVPDDPQQAGWFAAGPRPGEVGPAVILGHIDSRSGPGVFAHLSDLSDGSKVTVRTAGGSETFRVDRKVQVAKDHFPSESVYGPVPEPSLRLITCGGDFNRSTGHYVDNVIVALTLDRSNGELR